MSEKLREAARDVIRSVHYFNGTRPDVDMLAHLKALGELLDSSARLEAALAEPETCVWRLNDKQWATTCLHIFPANEGPRNNFYSDGCPGCGKRIEVKE